MLHIVCNVAVNSIDKLIYSSRCLIRYLLNSEELCASLDLYRNQLFCIDPSASSLHLLVFYILLREDYFDCLGMNSIKLLFGLLREKFLLKFFVVLIITVVESSSTRSVIDSKDFFELSIAKFLMCFFLLMFSESGGFSIDSSLSLFVWFSFSFCFED